MPPKTRRVQIDVPIHLSITLDGDPHERTAAYRALLDDIVESAERLARRYYLRWECGESLMARVDDECAITDLDLPRPTDPSDRRGAPGGAPGRRQGATLRGEPVATRSPRSTTPPADRGVPPEPVASRRGLVLVTAERRRTDRTDTADRSQSGNT
jgi:hypothetical protein